MSTLPVYKQTQIDLIAMEEGRPTTNVDRAMKVLVALQEHALTDEKRELFIARQLSVFDEHERARVECLVQPHGWLLDCLRYETPEILSNIRAIYPVWWEKSAWQAFVWAWLYRSHKDMQALLTAGLACPTQMQQFLIFIGASNPPLIVFGENEPWVVRETVNAMLAAGIAPTTTDTSNQNFLELVIAARLDLELGITAGRQSDLGLIDDLIWLIEQGFELRHGAMESLQQMLSRMTLGAQRDKAFDRIMAASRIAQSKSDTHAITEALGHSANRSQTRKRM